MLEISCRSDYDDIENISDTDFIELVNLSKVCKEYIIFIIFKYMCF